MNNRIFELANQVLPRETEFHQGDPKEYAYFFASHELQQFAELIVKECALVAGIMEHEGRAGIGKQILDSFEVE